MPLVSMRQLLDHAAENGYGLPAFNVNNLEQVLAIMDAANETHARPLCPPGQHHRLRRLTDYCTTLQVSEVPDPYYGGAAGFEQVLDIVEDACRGLLATLAPR
mgnify:CR=1 FL=1